MMIESHRAYFAPSNVPAIVPYVEVSPLRPRLPEGKNYPPVDDEPDFWIRWTPFLVLGSDTRTANTTSSFHFSALGYFLSFNFFQDCPLLSTIFCIFVSRSFFTSLFVTFCCLRLLAPAARTRQNFILEDPVIYKTLRSASTPEETPSGVVGLSGEGSEKISPRFGLPGLGLGDANLNPSLLLLYLD